MTTADTRLRTCMLDGQAPERTLAPGSGEEAAEAIRWARESQCALVPLGGGTAIQQGNLLKPGRWAFLSTESLDCLVDFSPDDMVVTAGAGVTLAELQAALLASGQFLACDAPFPSAATVGGIVATNADGLWRPMFGAPRDRLLGVRVVMADSSVIRGGGKVVKNVAGYDLCKLFANSWGTLGLVTEVTFKTGPLPPARTHRRYRTDSLAEAVTTALAVHEQRLQPAYLIAVTGDRPTLCVGLLGGTESVEWQQREIDRLAADNGIHATEEGPSEDELSHLVAGSAAPVTARISTVPSKLPDLVAALAGFEGTAVIHVPTGIVEVACAPDADDGAQREQAKRIAGIAPGASVVWTRVPTDWKSEMDVWGAVRGDFPLMHRIKQALDPDRLFSPGRFLGRL